MNLRDFVWAVAVGLVFWSVLIGLALWVEG